MQDDADDCCFGKQLVNEAAEQRKKLNVSEDTNVVGEIVDRICTFSEYDFKVALCKYCFIVTERNREKAIEKETRERANHLQDKKRLV